MQEQHCVSLGNGVPGAGNTDFLYLVIAVAQAGGVHHMHRHTLDLDGLLHLVAGGAGNWGDDGQLGAGQGVQQGRLAGVGLAGDHHLDAFAQQSALAGACQHRLHAGLQLGQLALGVRLLQKVDLFFWEVQRGLDQHAQVDQCL